MKRLNNIFQQIISIENLTLAESKARKGKSKQYGVKVFDKNPEENISNLHKMLSDREYKTSQYTTFTVFEPKERLVFRLPYFPDRITILPERTSFAYWKGTDESCCGVRCIFYIVNVALDYFLF